MIHSFACKNFYSFADKVTVDFTVNGNAPQNNSYFKNKSGTRLSKVEAVIGPNASGKTNLLKVLPFLKWLIVDSFGANPSAPLPVKPFAFGENEKKATELSVVFEISGKIYTYEFLLTQEKILSEKLKLTQFVKEKKSSKTIFYRIWNEKEKRYEFEGKKFSLPKEFYNLLRANASVISVAMRLNHKESHEIATFWQQLETNVVEAGWVGDSLLPNASQRFFESLIFYSKNKTLKKELEEWLARFDIGFSELEIIAKEMENGVNLQARVAHDINGKKYYLPLNYESSGTKQLLILLKNILVAIAQGSIAVIDELEVNLHPEIVIALVDLFIQPETNPNNAQLLFSTHSHLVLSRLDKYQIILTEKNEGGISESWRLDEMSGVRSDENYYTKYIAGAYGAVPKIQ